jgi:hypothetical protein
MNLNSVFCVAFSRLQADQMVQRLKGSAFSTQMISMIYAIGPLANELYDMVDSLRRQGIPIHKARLYHTQVNEGRILVSVQACSDEETCRAVDILSRAGGSEVYATQVREPALMAGTTPAFRELSNHLSTSREATCTPALLSAIHPELV